MNRLTFPRLYGLFVLGFAPILTGCSEAPSAPPPDSTVDAPPADPVAHGRQLHESLGCNVCHSLDGSQRTAGTFKGIFGTEVTLEDGRTIIRDAAYIKESILKPDAGIVKGSPDIMVSYADSVSEQDLDAFVALIESVGPEAAASGADVPAE